MWSTADVPFHEKEVSIVSLQFKGNCFQVQKIHACLSLISKSIRGTVTPDKSTLEVIKSLQLHQTPDLWHDLWSGPREPAEYLSTLVYKVSEICAGTRLSF
ncbi:hypothetical protein ANCCAN_29960 [Ancylostoma caninum]|uniref:Uncharacterized protein n=1 Tax=Ancylostoma caninum TaxID=29170 RepID=A0A368EXA6_ANCCA|nr:hypothetical protein ANCCAN_29960 [Ancylostoma caninum]